VTNKGANSEITGKELPTASPQTFFRCPITPHLEHTGSFLEASADHLASGKSCSYALLPCRLCRTESSSSVVRKEASPGLSLACHTSWKSQVLSVNCLTRPQPHCFGQSFHQPVQQLLDQQAPYHLSPDSEEQVLQRLTLFCQSCFTRSLVYLSILFMHTKLSYCLFHPVFAGLFLHSWECSFCKSNLLCRCMMCYIYISVFK
jgi:hypothetical protein